MKIESARIIIESQDDKNLYCIFYILNNQNEWVQKKMIIRKTDLERI